MERASRGEEPQLAEAATLLRGLAAGVAGIEGRVLTRVSGAVAEVVLDGPRARNALTAGMMADLADAVAWARAQDVGVIVVRSSTEGAFCAGGHLRQVREALVAPDAARAMCAGMTAVLDALLDAPQVSVALVDGPAIGGGAELACSADLRVFTSNGTMAWRQASLGVAAGWGGAHRLRDLVGPRRALAWMATGRGIGGPEAVAVGLADALVDDLREADAWLAALAATPAAALRACKRQVRARDAADEATAFLDVWGGPAHRRALGLD